MMLVNVDHPLPADYTISTQEAANGLLMETTAAQALQRMFAAAQADGIRLMCVSGYRTVQRQTELFNAKVQEYLNLGYSQEGARTEAAKLVQIPGSSEHNSGLAADIVYEGYWNDYDDLYEDFENSSAFAWLDEHAHEYGFILRYPKDKTDITGISYEPWHYRYVGSPEQALEIKNSGLCLEEYVASR